MSQRPPSFIDLLQHPDKWPVPWLHLRKVNPFTGRYVHATVLNEMGVLYLCFTLKDRAATPEQIVVEGWDLDPSRRRAA